MVVSLLLLLSILGAVQCRPSSVVVTPYGNFSNVPISPEDREFLRRLPTHRTITYPAGFKVMYVGQNGDVVNGSRPSGNYIKVVGSPASSQAAADRLASDVRKMLRLSPSHIFTNLAIRNAGVGVFTAAEKLTIFPEYARLKDTPECHGLCDGACSVTCTFDGRKWDSVGGVGGKLAVVMQDNVLCSNKDPYLHSDNTAVHEFSHTVDSFGFSAGERRLKRTAFESAKAQSLWRLNAYSMQTSAEYFAEATGAFFLVNLLGNTGGMNECYGTYQFCHTEMEARQHIQQHDPLLYNLLADVYTRNRTTEPSGLTVCPPP